MITFFCIAVILVVAYAQFREGLFTAFVNLVNVIIAGIATFAFFEPLADWLEPSLASGTLSGFEDFMAMALVFAAAFVALRNITNRLNPDMIDFNGNVQMGGGLIGAVTGYLLAGFFVAALETLPWHQNFLDFQPRDGTETAGPRTIFPPDRVWLAMMRHAGAYPLSWDEDASGESNYDRYPTFDRQATFEQRYLRYRRHTDDRGPKEYKYEMDRDLGRGQ
jgi:hypothetical protein